MCDIAGEQRYTTIHCDADRDTLKDCAYIPFDDLEEDAMFDELVEATIRYANEQGNADSSDTCSVLSEIMRTLDVETPRRRRLGMVLPPNFSPLNQNEARQAMQTVTHTDQIVENTDKKVDGVYADLPPTRSKREQNSDKHRKVNARRSMKGSIQHQSQLNEPGRRSVTSGVTWQDGTNDTRCLRKTNTVLEENTCRPQTSDIQETATCRPRTAIVRRISAKQNPPGLDHVDIKPQRRCKSAKTGEEVRREKMAGSENESEAGESTANTGSGTQSLCSGSKQSLTDSGTKSQRTRKISYYDPTLEKSEKFLHGQSKTFSRTSQTLTPARAGLRHLQISYTSTNAEHNHSVIFTDLLKISHKRNYLREERVQNLERRLQKLRTDPGRATTYYEHHKIRDPFRKPEKKKPRTVAEKKKKRQDKIKKTSEKIYIGYIPTAQTMKIAGPSEIEQLRTCTYLRLDSEPNCQSNQGEIET